MTALDPQAQLWRDAMLDTLRPLDPDTPLLLSGGTDSMAILSGLLALGRAPICFTYALEGYESPDLTRAREVTTAYSLTFEVVQLSASDEFLIEQTRNVIRLTGNTRKTAVQCCWALEPVLQLAKGVGFRRIITGTGGVVEDNRKATILSADYEKNRDELEQLRRDNLLGGNPTSATETMKQLGWNIGVQLIEPYSMDPLAETGLAIPFPEMNTPVQKGIALRSFPEFWGPDPARSTWWRKNASLQVAGGVRDHHEKLLEMDINRRGSKRVVGVYNDLATQEGALF